MREFKRPSSQAEFKKNFAQIHPLMNSTEAFLESSRCLFCYDAPCIQACPTGIDIPLFIRQINSGNIVGAAKTIYSRNYFGNTCGKVCPTQVLCEGACVYNEQDVKPIEIGRLQNFATQKCISEEISMFDKSASTGKKVAIIGAGPAGISCACELSRQGIQVDLFEARNNAGGLALFGTAPYKIENDEVNDEIDFLQKQLSFKINCNTTIKSKEDIVRLEREFDAILIATGLGETRMLKFPGNELENCIGATEFIESLKGDPLNTFIGKKVIVIGGGNTAMDAASECARMGADEVLIVYRKSRSDMKAYEFEIELAESVGVRIRFNAEIVQAIGTKKLEAVEIRTADLKGEESLLLPCDMLVLASGQEKRIGLFERIGLDIDMEGRVVTVKGHHRCKKNKYFVGGDAWNGGAEVVNACAEGKKAAMEIMDFLNE